MIWDILNGNPRIIEDEEFKWLADRKSEAVRSGDETTANEVWKIEQISGIWNMYINAFSILKEKSNHQEVWNTLAQIEIKIGSLRKHYNVSDQYKLLFIESTVREFQKLFPYKLFTSRESIIKETRCSICGQIRSLRNPCGHIKGELYNGEMCYREITDMEFIAIALVSNPVDKYAVIDIQGEEYSYKLLDTFIENLEKPFDKWKVDIIKIKDPVYKKVGRNKPCPCGSGIKYKKCCMKSGNDMMDHFEFSLQKDMIKPDLIGKRFIL